MDKPLKVTKDKTYQLTVTTTSGWAYSYNVTSDKTQNLRYEVWGTDDYYTTTDADGKYTYYADEAEFTGTLHAISSVSKFNTLTFANVTTNQSEQNFYSLTRLISGTVYDSYGNPIKEATVAKGNSVPEPELDCEKRKKMATAAQQALVIRMVEATVLHSYPKTIT